MLPADVLLAEFSERATQDRCTTVEPLIRMGAIDEREHYKPRACAPMCVYCRQGIANVDRSPCLDKAGPMDLSDPAVATGPLGGAVGTGALPQVTSQVVRDAGQCTITAPDGRICCERSGLELDKVLPCARGGKSTADNPRLLCGGHNPYEAERVYGAEYVRMERKKAKANAELAQRARGCASESGGEAEDRRRRPGRGRGQPVVA